MPKDKRETLVPGRKNMSVCRFNATMKAMQTTMSAAQRVLEDSIKTVREPFKE